MGSVVGANILPGTQTLIFQHFSSGKVAEKVPVKLGSPMFRYLVTSFKCHLKGMLSYDWVNLFLGSAIYRVEIEEN